MKILLTGSGGFTGTFFKNFLAKEKAEIFTMGTKKLPNERHFKISKKFSIKEIKKSYFGYFSGLYFSFSWLSPGEF